MIAPRIRCRRPGWVGRLALAACIALSAANAGAAEPELSANAKVYLLRNAARVAYEGGEWQLALASYDAILRALPADAQALNGKGEVLFFKLKRPRDAIVPFLAATRALPASPRAWDGLCGAQIDAGDFEAALASCERAVRLYPESIGAAANLAHADLFLGRREEALKRYGEAIKLAPDEKSFETEVIGSLDRFIARQWRPDEVGDMKRTVQGLWKADQDKVLAGGGKRIVATLNEVLQVGTPEELRNNRATILAALDLAKGDPLIGDLAEVLSQVMVLTNPMSSLSADEVVAVAAKARAIVDRRYGTPHPLSVLVDTIEALGAMLHKQYPAAEAAALRALAASAATRGEFDKDNLAQVNLLSAIYLLSGKTDLQVQVLQRQLDIAENVTGAESPETLVALNALAEALQRAEQVDAALALQPRIAALVARSYPADSLEAIAQLVSQASLHIDADSFELAEPMLVEARTRSERAFGAESAQTGQILQKLARLYRQMGVPEKALPLWERSIAIAQKNVNTYQDVPASAIKNDILALESGDSAILIALYHGLNRHDEAMLQAERFARQAEAFLGPNHPALQLLMANKGWLHINLEQYDVAAAQMASLLANPRLQGQALEVALAVQAEANLKRGDAQAAAVAATRLVALQAQKQQSPVALAAGRFLMARAEKMRGHTDLAIFHGKVAINEVQSMRSRLTRLDRELQQGFLRQNESDYQDLASWLIEEGRIAEAEQVLAMLKAREFFELTRGNDGEPATRRADFVGSAEQRALAEQEKLALKTVGQARELDELELRNKQGTLSADDRVRRLALLDVSLTWRADYQRYLASLVQRFAKASRDTVTEGAVDLHTRLQDSVAKDPDGAIGLHYVVVADRIGIIVSTPRGSFGRFSRVTKKQLHAEVGNLRLAVMDHGDTRPAARALWRMLIAPVEADIRASGAKTLVLSLTDILRYVPFAALEDGDGHYLIESYALSLWAAAANVDPVASKDNWRVNAMGLTKARPGFSALPAVRSELEGIVLAPGSRGVLPGQIAMDEQFNRDQFDAALSSKANVLHVASHFEFHPGNERTSVLVMGSGAPLTLGQLAVMDFSSLEQLTLSACNTATGGGVNENGAEVEGLAAAVLRRRAKSVLATLWQVSDESTADLMHRFYAQRVQAEPPSRAQALRAAQLALIQAGRAAEAAGSQPAAPSAAKAAASWAHPYYWAPFVLSGSWL